MLIATSAAAVVVASALAAGAFAPAVPGPPAIVVNVSAAPNVPASIVAKTIAETDALFQSAGVSFIWRVGMSAFTTLSVVIGNEPGSAPNDETPLGWIAFEDGRPDSEIYLSFANAEKFLLEAQTVVGVVNKMPRAERELLLGRAMGRALAHELGHYLLATKAHTAKGLLKAVRSAQEFFSVDRRRFQLEPAQQMRITERLQADGVVADRQKLGGARRSRGSNE